LHEPPPTADDMRRRAGRGPAPVSGRVEERRSGFVSGGARSLAAAPPVSVFRDRARARPPRTHFGLLPES